MTIIQFVVWSSQLRTCQSICILFNFQTQKLTYKWNMQKHLYRSIYNKLPMPLKILLLSVTGKTISRKSLLMQNIHREIQVLFIQTLYRYLCWYTVNPCEYNQISTIIIGLWFFFLATPTCYKSYKSTLFVFYN